PHSRLRSSALRRVAALSEATVAITPRAADVLASWGIRCECIFNPIPLEPPAEISREPRGDSLELIFVGTYGQRKGCSVLVDAMAFRLAVVATRVGGIPDVMVDGETGRLVAPGDPAALADALAGFEDADLRSRCGEAAGRQIRVLCDPHRLAARWRDLYAH